MDCLRVCPMIFNLYYFLFAELLVTLQLRDGSGSHVIVCPLGICPAP